MRAIAAEQVDGFPKKDELRTIFVEHEIPEREVGEDAEGFPILNIDLNGIDWVVDACINVYKCDREVTRAEVAKVMEGIGFGNSENGTGKDRAADAGMLITTYSGGWKMKMQLCAAQLVQADLLMLDEPTGHLDVTNIAWLQDWLRGFMSGGGTVIATSHDTSFLNSMSDALIDFEERKLRTFRGKKGAVLSEFVAKNPEKAGYFELKNDVAKFVFPVPGPLAGVKSKSRHLVKMSNVTFQYPSRDTPTVFGINLEASRVSRVAVIGANGAGKSTAIKLLTGELHASTGEVVRHPNLRLAYVAQHAFQHLEKHLTKTPTQYILHRFAGGDDKEAVDFKANSGADENVEKKKFFMHAVTMQLKLCEEPKEFAKAIEPEAILDRRENKKEKKKEYLTKLLQKPVEDAIWIERETLVQMGFLSKVQREDEKQAMAAGLMNKALTTEGIEKHLKDFGLDAETASHTSIQSLSGGQKVKVVLGASMWLDPHILILDEPTNYLDRDALGALTLAIKESEGGVIIISHNREFCNAVATEKWIMQGGRLRQEGESVGQDEPVSAIQGIGQQDAKFDSFGNVVKMNEADMDAKAKKKAIKDIEKQLKANKKSKSLSQDEVWELEDRLEKLKGSA
jgi:elongation factor 3